MTEEQLQACERAMADYRAGHWSDVNEIIAELKQEIELS